MKTIQHEDTGCITQIEDDVPIPRRWFECMETIEPTFKISSNSNTEKPFVVSVETDNGIERLELPHDGTPVTAQGRLTGEIIVYTKDISKGEGILYTNSGNVDGDVSATKNPLPKLLRRLVRWVLT